MNVDIFGYFAAILTTAAFLPQLIKTLKTKKADDVSLTTLIMFIIGVLSWIIYGYVYCLGLFTVIKFLPRQY